MSFPRNKTTLSKGKILEDVDFTPRTNRPPQHGRLRRSMGTRGKYGGYLSIQAPAASQAGIVASPTLMTRRATSRLRQNRRAETNKTATNAKIDHVSAASHGAVPHSIGLKPTPSIDTTSSLELMLSNSSEAGDNALSGASKPNHAGSRRLSTKRVSAINKCLNERKKADLDDASLTSTVTADTTALTSGLSSRVSRTSGGGSESAVDQEVIFLLSKVVELLSDKPRCDQEHDRSKNRSPAKGKNFGEGSAANGNGGDNAKGGSEKHISSEVAAPCRVMPVSDIAFRGRSASRRRRGFEGARDVNSAIHRGEPSASDDSNRTIEGSDDASRWSSTGPRRKGLGNEPHRTASNGEVSLDEAEREAPIAFVRAPQASRSTTFRGRSRSRFGNKLGAAATRKDLEQVTPVASNRAPEETLNVKFRARSSSGTKPRFGSAPSHTTPNVANGGFGEGDALTKVREPPSRRQELERLKNTSLRLSKRSPQDNSMCGGGSQEVRAENNTIKKKKATNRVRGSKVRGRSTSRSKGRSQVGLEKPKASSARQRSASRDLLRQLRNPPPDAESRMAALADKSK